MRKLLALITLLTLTCPAPGIAAGIAPGMAETQEQWYVVLHGEDRVGSMQTITTTGEGGHITSIQAVKLAMGRAGAVVNIEVRSSFTETAEGKPVEASAVVDMGGVPMVSRAVFNDHDITLTSGQGKRVTTQNHPAIEGEWMPPAAMRRYVARQLAEDAKEINVRTVDISMGLRAVDMSMKVVGREDVEVYGKTRPAIVWDATVSAMPGVTVREYVGEDGRSIKSTITLMPGLELTVVEADEALATSELTPAEMMAQTFVVPSRKIERPRELRRGVYRLSLRNNAPMPELPSVGAQRFEMTDSGAVVTVNVAESVEEAAPGEEYLAASAVLNHEDPAVKAWLDPMATMRFADRAAMAEWLRNTVHTSIDTKDLSVGFATASDVARTKQGDCTEHAVLLAALLRGAGIPSRCVSGLVYADQFAGHEGIFGYHMWTQAWIAPVPAPGNGADGEGRWIDFDATLPGAGRFDATHITLSVSDMNGGLVSNDMAALVPLLGNLDIEVVETGYGE